MVSASLLICVFLYFCVLCACFVVKIVCSLAVVSCDQISTGNSFQDDANPNGFRPNYFYLSETESYYTIHMQSLTWFDAKQKCALEGASLFYPEDEAEANLLLGYVKRTERVPAEVFIGVSDLVAKGVFETVDGRPISAVYNKWAPEVYDKWAQDDCVIIQPSTGYLNDVPCGWIRSYICKKRNSAIKWNDLCNIPDNSYEYNAKTGKCYKFHTTPMTWPQAHATCTVEQSYLAIINNAHEAEELAKITKAATANKVNGTFLMDTVLLGFHDRLQEGWSTLKGQSLEDSGYFTWGQQQTDNAVQRQCGAMYFDSLLKNVECDKQALFICEHDLDVIKNNE